MLIFESYAKLKRGFFHFLRHRGVYHGPGAGLPYWGRGRYPTMGTWRGCIASASPPSTSANDPSAGKPYHALPSRITRHGLLLIWTPSRSSPKSSGNNTKQSYFAK